MCSVECEVCDVSSGMEFIKEMNEPLLEVKKLSVAFGFGKGGKPAKDKSIVQVTDKVSFHIDEGEFFALVGESGSGKSVTSMGILRLLPTPSARILEGSVLLRMPDGGSLDLTKLSLEEMRKIRGSEIACIFQEPMQALNPVLNIKKQLLEALRRQKLDQKTALEVIVSRLKEAGFADPARVLQSYPHELSGGMLQRICIVMALLQKPRLIIADEPTTALDVTVQAQVLAVLKELAKNSGTAVLLITHNMGIVSQYAQRIAVMYAGRIVETGDVDDVIGSPLHPYTRGLLAAIPESRGDIGTLRCIPGQMPHARDFLAGCRFAPRCELLASDGDSEQSSCLSEKIPPCVQVGSHQAYCFKIKP